MYCEIFVVYDNKQYSHTYVCMYTSICKLGLLFCYTQCKYNHPLVSPYLCAYVLKYREYYLPIILLEYVLTKHICPVLKKKPAGCFVWITQT